MKEKTIYGQTKKRKKIQFGKLEEKKKRTFFAKMQGSGKSKHCIFG